MKSFHGLMAGVLLLAAFAGCSKDDKKVNNKGSFSPIITGIHDATSEPATRGVPNELHLLVTNVNGLLLTVHWSSPSGSFSDSTTEVATWTPPDTIGTYYVTVSVEASDAERSFFKTSTFAVYVDNQFERWTQSDAIQFDQAPSTNGSLVYVELNNNVTGTGDVWRLSSPLGAPEKLTTDFFKVASPTPRGDEQQVAFEGRRRSNDSTSIWLMPWSGADTLTATKLTQANQPTPNPQFYLSTPRFSWNGGFLMYASDSDNTFPKLWYRDVISYNAPVRLVSYPFDQVDLYNHSYLPANWGKGGTNIAPPESIITAGVLGLGFVGQTRLGLIKFKTILFGETPPITDNPWIPDTTMAEPDWSSDGNYIVFSRREPTENHRDIWIIATNATDFSQAKQVTRGPADDSHPRFSKDGQTIYFVSNRQNNYGVNGIFATERRGTNLWAVRRFDLP